MASLSKQAEGTPGVLQGNAAFLAQDTSTHNTGWANSFHSAILCFLGKLEVATLSCCMLIFI